MGYLMDLIKTTEVLGNVGDFLGSIAVIVTLIYLSIQIRQINRNSSLLALQATRAERIHHAASNRDSPVLIPIELKLARKEPLTEEERRRITQHAASTFAMMYWEWITDDMDLRGEYGTSHHVMYEWINSREPVLEFWRNSGQRIYPPRFVDYIERGLALASASGIDYSH